jgi:uncharacterized protein
MLRVVLDTNVIVSSVISKKGPPFLIIQAWKETRFVMVISVDIVKEVQRVLFEPRMVGTFHLTENRITRFIDTLYKDTILVAGKSDSSGAVPKDPSDEMFISAAIDAKAHFIVSGDKHLLNIGSFKKIPIVSPRQFLDLLEQEYPSRKQ